MKKNDTVHKRTLSAKQVIRLTGFGRDRVYELLRSGELPSIKSGKKFAVPDVVFEEWLKTCGGTIRQAEPCREELVEA